MELNNNSKEREVRIDIESGEASNGSHGNWSRISLNSFLGRIFGYDGSNESAPRANSEYQSESTELLVDRNLGSQQSPVENESENEIERRRGGKVKKAPKPPRPPKGPSLDAADMRLLKEISRIAIKKRERMERVKAFKRMKAAKAMLASTSSSSSPTSSPSLSPSAATISAMFVTVFFLLMLFFQGISSTTSSHFIPAVAPQPAPMTTGLTPVEFYKTIMSDDGAAPNFLPPRAKVSKTRSWKLNRTIDRKKRD